MKHHHTLGTAPRLLVAAGLTSFSLLAAAQTLPPAATAAPVPSAAPAAPAAPAPAAPPNPMGEGQLYVPGFFDSVEISGAAEVRYVQGDSDQVFVEGAADVQRTVAVELQGKLLRIRTQGGWKFWNARRLQLQITSRNLSRLVILGAADVLAAGVVKSPKLAVHIAGAGLARFDQLRVDQLLFSVSGAGDGQITGLARDLNVTVSGKGEFRGEQLMATRARVDISGIGDVKVWAVEDLSISVSGVGQVDYWGTPRVRFSSSAISSINPRGPKPPLPALP